MFVEYQTMDYFSPSPSTKLIKTSSWETKGKPTGPLSFFSLLIFFSTSLQLLLLLVPRVSTGITRAIGTYSITVRGKKKSYDMVGCYVYNRQSCINHLLIWTQPTVLSKSKEFSPFYNYYLFFLQIIIITNIPTLIFHIYDLLHFMRSDNTILYSSHIFF